VWTYDDLLRLLNSVYPTVEERRRCTSGCMRTRNSPRSSLPCPIAADKVVEEMHRAGLRGWPECTQAAVEAEGVPGCCEARSGLPLECDSLRVHALLVGIIISPLYSSQPRRQDHSPQRSRRLGRSRPQSQHQHPRS